MGEAPSAAVPTSRRLRTITPPPPFLGWAREAASLDGVDPELGLAFWRVLRRVRAWAETPPGERARMSGSGREEARERLGVACAHAPALVEALGTFALLVRAPGEVEARRLSEACRQVHAWAEERSLLPVAMLFAEAAAYADPDDPARANDAGRMCRRAAEDERASSWYHRGYGLGVRRQDDTETIRAQIGYGNLMKDLGHHEEARKFLERAARRAINTGRRRQAGEAHHDLLLMCAQIGAFAEARRHTNLAVKFYPVHHPQVPALAHDFAFLLVRERHFSAAVTLLDLALPRIPRPEIQTVVWGTLARALAGARLRDRFVVAEQRVIDLVQKYEEYAPAALVSVAEGATAFSDWERAKHYASMALAVAQARKDVEPERVAADLLRKIGAQESPPHDVTLDEKSLALTRRVAAMIRKWKAPSKALPGADRATAHTPLT